jgi:hypothetical protein
MLETLKSLLVTKIVFTSVTLNLQERYVARGYNTKSTVFESMNTAV